MLWRIQSGQGSAACPPRAKVAGPTLRPKGRRALRWCPRARRGSVLTNRSRGASRHAPQLRLRLRLRLRPRPRLRLRLRRHRRRSKAAAEARRREQVPSAGLGADVEFDRVHDDPAVLPGLLQPEPHLGPDLAGLDSSPGCVGGRRERAPDVRGGVGGGLSAAEGGRQGQALLHL